MVTNQSKRYLFRESYSTLCDFMLLLNTLVPKSSDLPEFKQKHNAAMFSSKRKIFALQIRNT